MIPFSKILRRSEYRYILPLSIALFAAVPAQAQQVNLYCFVTGAGSFNNWQPCSATNPLPVSATITPSGTQNVNITQVLGAAPSATNPIWVAPATASTPWAVTGSGAAGTAAAGVVTIQGIASMTPVQTTSSSAGNVPIGITPTDRTVTSATGSSQTVMNANSSRKQLTIVNTGNANCGINPTGGTAVIGGAGTLTLAPLGAYTPRVPSLAAITAICTAAQPLYADES